LTKGYSNVQSATAGEEGDREGGDNEEERRKTRRLACQLCFHSEWFENFLKTGQSGCGREGALPAARLVPIGEVLGPCGGGGGGGGRRRRRVMPATTVDRMSAEIRRIGMGGGGSTPAEKNATREGGGSGEGDTTLVG
jgi:hypothetical protein